VPGEAKEAAKTPGMYATFRWQRLAGSISYPQESVITDLSNLGNEWNTPAFDIEVTKYSILYLRVRDS